MKGLLRNNFYAASSSAVMFSAVLLLWGIFVVTGSDPALLMGYVLSGMVGFSVNGIFSIQRELSSKWGKYKLTFPVRRAEIVRSYYISQLIWLLVGTLFAAVGAGLFWHHHGLPFDLYILPVFALGISVSFFTCAVFFPLFYWNGEERDEIFLVAALVCAIAVNAGLVTLLNLVPAVLGTVSAILVGTAALILCSTFFFVLSYLLTVKLYNRKEY